MYQLVKNCVPVRYKRLVWNALARFSYARTSLQDHALRTKHRITRKPLIPPPELICLVAGHYNAAWFLRGGLSASLAIRQTLKKNGVAMEELTAVLDFGCGCGRIMRHWSTLQGPALHGTDYNPLLIDWCRRHLSFASFQTNTLTDVLPYESETFDLIYAF